MEELIKFLESKGFTAEADRLRKGDTNIHLSDKNIGNEGAVALAKGLKNNNSIIRLNLNYNQIGSEGAKAIGEGLKTNNSITQLYLSHNQIGDDGAKEIAKALTINTKLKLTQLYLSYNQIGDDGAKEIAKALTINTKLKLTQLYLSYNQIGDDGAKEIAETLKNNNSVTDLNLHNNQIGDEGAKEIAEALKNNHSITELDLSCNKITKNGAKEIAEALKINKTITDLTFCHNQIGDEGGKEIVEALKDNHSITKLNLYNHAVSTKVTMELYEYLARNKRIAQKNNLQAEDLNTEGNILANKKEYDKALEKYNEAIAITANPLYLTNKATAEENHKKQQKELEAQRQKAELEAKKKAEEAKAKLEAQKQAELLKQQEELFNKLLSTVQDNKLEDAKALIQNSEIQIPNKKIDDNNGSTLLHYAAEKGSKELYELLCSKMSPEAIEATNNKGEIAETILTQVQQQMEEIMMKEQSDIQKINALIVDGNAKITPEEKGILIFGKTGAGKSTLTYYLAGEKLKVNNTGILKGTLENIEDNVDNIKINHTLDSETKIPGKYKVGDTTIIDLPGFGDTGGATQEIPNAFYIKRLFDVTKQVKFVLAIEEPLLRTKGYILGLIEQFTKTFSKIEPLKNSLSIIITKASNDTTKDDIKQIFKMALDNNQKKSPFALELLKFLKESGGYTLF